MTHSLIGLYLLLLTLFLLASCVVDLLAQKEINRKFREIQRILDKVRGEYLAMDEDLKRKESNDDE